MKNRKITTFLFVILLQVSIILAETNSEDYAALLAITNGWGNKPSSWQGSDPCTSWVGLKCNNFRVTELQWASLGLTGQLTGDIASLPELTKIDLSYNTGLKGSLPEAIGKLKKLTNLSVVGCSFTGTIPDSIGSIPQLYLLALNSNGFTGKIPPSFGNLENLYWLDLSENQLTGSIPVSNASSPGLDLLLKTKHFHFGRNNLSGAIPETLFNSGMQLIHLLFDNNMFSGSLPSTLGLVKTLESVRFDFNSLTGDVPTNLNNLTNLQELFLSNNNLKGNIPDLSGMDQLSYVDLSNNSFNSSSSVPEWFSSLTSLTTLIMQQTNLNGTIPSPVFELPSLQTLVFKDNQIGPGLELGSSFSSNLQLIDLQHNAISEFTPDKNQAYGFQLMLYGNAYCLEGGAPATYCSQNQQSNNAEPYSTPTNGCSPPQCDSGQVSSPNCSCAYPYTGSLIFRSPSFSNLGIKSNYQMLESSLIQSFTSFSLSIDSVSVSNPTRDATNYLTMSLAVFPSGKNSFNETEVTLMAIVFSNQFFKPPGIFGPYNFMATEYDHFSDGEQKKSSHVGVAIGAAIGAFVVLLLLVGAGFYAYRQRQRADMAVRKTDPFATWDTKKSFGAAPQLKGTRAFSFEELKISTNGFSDDNNIGAGGYGKVFKGILQDGKMVAIKRAEAGSMQGAVEFKNEIELLSRVHHRNLVNLIGFCYEQGEQMLVYEFMPNGTLMDSLTGKSGFYLDWVRRLRVAYGSASGLHYLHELADPPIIHRDIKSSNILLDARLSAKVADFGLSKSFDEDQSYVTTQVKGTLGYLDPEYYMTNQLTERSDIYSFGVVMLELVSGRPPIYQGKYIVREVRTLMDQSRDLYGLHEILDPVIAKNTILLVGFEKFVDLALRCVEESAPLRPRMGEVLKEIEKIMESAGVNPNVESAPTSSNYGETSGSSVPSLYGDKSLFDYSGSIPSATVQPH